MRYSVLGTTQVHHADGTPVPLGGARLRALLGGLALAPGRVVSVETLVDDVWGGQPPADATGALQALVGRLRRAVGAAAVDSAAGGYRLVADPDEVDLHRFTRLAGEGARALAEGDAVKALGSLDEALALWRGPALADLPDGDRAEAARAEARRRAAARDRLTALVALGRAAECLPELAAACAADPLDEPLHALRIRALRATGRPAEALAAYAEIRARLADRLGTDPGPELRALHAELLTPARGATPAAPPVSRGNLRARLTSFVGREDDLEALRGDLRGARLVTLLGTGGAGKTRLSQEAGERASDAYPDAYPDGVWLAELAPVDDPESVPETVLLALGARQTVLRGAGAEELRAAEAQGGDPLVRLVEHCRHRRMLLIVDNCEHVVDAAAGLVARVLEHCPGVTVLATSREPLGVPGEVVRPVGPLSPDAALRLLGERGAAARPGFTVQDDPRACAEICRRLDGLPLAVELAAARLRMLTPRQIADRLDDRFRLLTGGSRTALPRQQTLRAVVDWSWDLLDHHEHTVLRRLSVFAGGCDLVAVEAVCADPADRTGGTDALTVLGTLVDKSLVVAAPGDGSAMRYRLLETVAEYAAERLDATGEREAVERRHLVHYRELARTTDPLLRRSEQLAALSLFDQEYENLRTALRRAVAARDEQEALCLVMSLGWYWQLKDLRTESHHWSSLARELGPDPFTDDTAPAGPVFERFTDAPPPMGPGLLAEARRSNELLRMVTLNRDFDMWTSPENMVRLRQITRVYRPGLPQVCRFPGNLWFFAVLLTDDGSRVPDMLDTLVRSCREYGYEWELAVAVQFRSNVLSDRSPWSEEAFAYADEAWRIFQRLGDVWGAAEALASRAEARERCGDFALAAEDYRAAVACVERIGAPGHQAVLRARLGGALLELGGESAEDGEAVLREVVAAQGDQVHEATAVSRILLGMWLGRTGRRDEARELLTGLLDLFGASKLLVFHGMVKGYLAWLDHRDGRHRVAFEAAVDAMRMAAEPLSTMIAPHFLATHLVTVAGTLAAVDPGRARDSARLLAVADGRRPSGACVPAWEREARELIGAELRAVLGEETFTAAYEEGGGLSIEEATALV
ncbi:BTAD domain-containing putative transcriptional regulator [Streptomyces qinzhouensis]|uniref:AfsR/SARP family transcriptional regulator n=1 Tax=Streptomyces qinzhouensis TaxID=2599401 RepID=A0A5B8IDL4_9ACTN|nr:BTAD domain-containing putative transcriptional regulator [Streptomyces qinzhouensis]QDY76488.1 AfsR/SARP family transcriptional regulator [Streptomyces qinzhouensis]